MKSLLPILLLLSIVFTGCNNNRDTDSASTPTATTDPLAIPALFERTGTLATAAEWPQTKGKITELNARIAKNRNDVKARLQIATIYLTEARITGEHPYYYPAIEKILDGVLSIDPKSFEATVFKASVKMSQHKFAEAKELAEKAKQLAPDNAYPYGILVDANVELGNYEAAVANSDKMQSLKPSLESYSRASYLREIYGDYAGAIEAMKLAVSAGLPGSEPQCWSRNTLAQLYLHTNQLAKAETEYKAILAERPSYAFAFAGLAKIAHNRKDYKKALSLLDSAAAIMPEFSFHEQMADIYAEQGLKDKANAKFAEVESMLKQDAASGHSVSLEMCKLMLKMGKPDEAKKYALEEYSIRPTNIDVNKELAWIAYKENNFKKAAEYLQAALKTNSKDPELLQRAAAINKALK
jgi:tetratricopeptide (TPR) repeat protein